MIFIENSVSMGDRLVSLKEMFGDDKHNVILGIRAVFVESLSSAAVQYPCKSPITMCSRYRRPKKSSMYFQCLPVEVALSIFNARCFFKSNF
jgi:hypothetical protein